MEPNQTNQLSGGEASRAGGNGSSGGDIAQAIGFVTEFNQNAQIFNERLLLFIAVEIQNQLAGMYHPENNGENNPASLDMLISNTVRQMLLGEQRGEQHEITGLMQQIISQVANYLFNADENEISVLQTKIQEVLPKIITQMIQAGGDSTNPLKEMDKAVKALLHANYIIERTLIPSMQKSLEDLKGRISALESVKIEPASSTEGNRTSSSNKLKGCC